MASLWDKTKFYLGLVDEEQVEAEESGAGPVAQSGVRTVEPPRPVRSAGTTEPVQSWRSQGVAGRRVEPPSRQRRRISSNPSHAEAGVIIRDAPQGPAGLQPLPPAGEPEAEVVVARAFSDAQALADHIREGRPVVLDLRYTEPEMVRRLVDFSSGLTYALDGRMAKIAQGVILVTPARVTLSAAEQERLAALGLYTSAPSES
jgi:cell division inhibitor SepF